MQGFRHRTTRIAGPGVDIDERSEAATLSRLRFIRLFCHVLWRPGQFNRHRPVAIVSWTSLNHTCCRKFAIANRRMPLVVECSNAKDSLGEVLFIVRIEFQIDFKRCDPQGVNPSHTKQFEPKRFGIGDFKVGHSVRPPSTEIIWAIGNAATNVELEHTAYLLQQRATIVNRDSRSISPSAQAAQQTCLD